MSIVRQLVRGHTAIPWRMSVEEYRAASATVSLDPQPFTASWSPQLPDAIRARGKAVYEEQLIRSLLEDLSGH